MIEYNEIKNAIKVKLADYIRSQVAVREGVSDITFNCINPDHPDKNPSMFIDYKTPHICHCRSCGKTYSIFHAAHILEEFPLRGRAFIEDNVNKLAVRFNLEPLDMRELTEDELAKLKLYDIYDAACELIANPDPKENIITHEYANKLGISAEICKKFGIGTVTDYQKFIDKVKEAGEWSTDEVVQEAGLRQNLLNEHMVSYCVADSWGRTVALASRDLMYDGRFGFPKEPTYADPHTGKITDRQKWRNSPSSLIYQKSETLYGYHALKYLKNENKVYVVEGYADAAVMWSYGIPNVVCIGSVGITPKHLAMLKDAEFQFVVMAFDNDDAGLGAIDKILEDGFKAIPYITPQVLVIPKTIREDGKEDQDPDTYIKNFGKDKFLGLYAMSAFEYQLKRMPELHSDAEKEAFVDRFLPLLSNEPNALTQNTMRHALAQKVGVGEVTIRESQRNFEKKYDLENRQRLVRSFKKMRGKFEEALELSPDDAVEIITNFSTDVFKAFNSKKLENMSMNEVTQGLNSFSDKVFSQSISPTWTTGWGWWDDIFFGIPKKGKLIGIPGASHQGKSLIMMNLLLQLLEIHGDDPSFQVIYWTIDDDREELMTKLVAILCNLHIAKVTWAAHQDDVTKGYIKYGFSKLSKWIKSGALCMKDSSIGTSIDALESQLEYISNKYPHKQPVLFIDNFGDISCNGQDKWATQERNLEKISLIKKSMTVVSSFELNKEGFKEENSNKAGNIKGVSDLLYKIDLNLLLNNPLLRERDKTKNQNANHTLAWVDDYGKNRPIMEVTIKKAKVPKKEQFYGSVYLRMNENTGKADFIGPEDKLEKFKMENSSHPRKWSGPDMSTWDNGANSVAKAKKMYDDASTIKTAPPPPISMNVTTSNTTVPITGPTSKRVGPVIIDLSK